MHTSLKDYQTALPEYYTTGVDMNIYGGCKTTAMGIMPHKDIGRALDLALSLDIPFWPQLPHVSFFEDMYAQSSQHFPGIHVDTEGERVTFDTARFEEELLEYSERIADPELFTLSKEYSVVYHRFLERDFEGYHAIRGQITGPVSFGFKIVDENVKPIIYNDDVRGVLFDFMQRKVNVQCQELRQKNKNAFVWLDEPGLGWVFSSLSGYNDVQARQDYRDFVSGIDGIKSLHLCANVNLPYLLELGIDILSFDAYQIATMPRDYAESVARYLNNGGVIAWGIVPTDSTSLGQETEETLHQRLLGYWDVLSRNSDLEVRQIAEQAMLAPARCCLKNIGQESDASEMACQLDDRGQELSIEEVIVEKAFTFIREMSQMLKQMYSL